MSYTPPTLAELRAQAVTSIESKTGDNVPIYEKAFYSIIATALSLLTYPLYKYISWNYNQSFVTSADEEHLMTYHGIDEGITRQFATKTEFDVELTVSDPTVISISTTFENEATGLFYFPKQSKSVTASDDSITLIADGYGEEYATEVGDELKIVGGVTGVADTCAVSEIVVYAMDKQGLEDYRKSILLSRGGVTGGSTASDYRKHSQAVSGVYRSFPFSGRPEDPLSSLPGDRSVFVEADHELGTDGVASVTLLNNVKAALITDPDTGLERECLGLTASNLYVSSVELVTFNIDIYDLNVDASKGDELRDAIATSLADHLKTLSPFVPSIDPEYERNDNVSSMSISNVINEIAQQYSAYASSVAIEEVGVGFVDNRILIGGDLARLNSVSYYVN